ncbi:MAG: cobalamin-dependent protein [Peptococcaceae bacterium]|nr:cobalamin-dependent protein [Peptococcaceae bacterium]
MALDYSKIFTRYDLKVTSKQSETKILVEDQDLQEIMDIVIRGETSSMAGALERTLNRKEPQEIIYRALIPAMEYVSRLWDENVYYLPQTLNASDAMQVGIEICEQKMGGSMEKKGLIITHTAEGDIHDLGQKIVNALLRAQGYEVLDLGCDVPVEQVVDAVKQHRPVMLTGTAGMSTNMEAFRRIAEKLSEAGLEIPFACGGGGGVSRTYITSFDLGVYGRDAAEAPPMAGDACSGLCWKEIRQKYNQ